MHDFTPPPCKICGQSSVYIGATANDQSATRVLHHCRCTSCGLVFIGNAISTQELSVAYGSFDTGEYYEQIREETARKFDSAITDLRTLASANSAIIDLGTGNGGFLRKLLDNGFRHVAGQEIPGMDLSGLERLGCRIYHDTDYSTVPSAAFDVVTLLDVAEHVIDPQRLFQACSRILRPGGLVYFHTPVVTRTDRLMHSAQRLPAIRKLGQAWQRGRTSIFHLQNYTPAAIEMVLGKAGFERISVTVKNELSWPVSGYVKVYLCQKFGLPEALAPVLAPLFHPLLASNFFNPNKAIVTALKA